VPLAQTGLAVGDVSRFLAGILTSALWNVPPNPTITVQRPQANPGTGTTTQPRINLFLYEVEIDAAMRNVPLTSGSSMPLWLVLRYVLTGFDKNGESDTPDSHDLMGMAMQVLMGVGTALPALAGYTSLSDNPEPLKLTFDQATPELLSRLMQGPDDKYRCSAAFQVRPVLIAEPLPPSGMQLVGINYVLGTKIGLAGVKNFVLPNLGPVLTGAHPLEVELGDTLTLTGESLNGGNLTVSFGAATLVPNKQQPQAMAMVVNGIDPTVMSADKIAVSVRETLASGLVLSSGLVNVSLLPTVASVSIAAIAKVSSTNPNVYATLTFKGKLLGSKRDYIECALVWNGKVAILLDTPDLGFVPLPDQSKQQFAMTPDQAVPQGEYFVVLRINGQQAKQTFTLSMVSP
jgi:hypothetical protein